MKASQAVQNQTRAAKPRRCVTRCWHSIPQAVAALAIACGCGAGSNASSSHSAPSSTPSASTPNTRAKQRAATDWLGELTDPNRRTKALDNLFLIVETGLSEARGDWKAPAIQALINDLVEPLSRVYVEHYAQLDRKVRVSLIEILAMMLDPRAEAAYAKAFEGFALAPASDRAEQDIRWASYAASHVRLEASAEPMIRAFNAFHASTPLGGVSFRNLNEAMVFQRHSSWLEPLIAKLESDIVAPRSAKDGHLIDAFRDELFWQVTAAEVLGYLGEAEAVSPLIRVLLDPDKADVHATALLALVKLGPATTPAAQKLLLSRAPALVAFSKERQGAAARKGASKQRDAHVSVAALILGTLGRQEALAAMMRALRSSVDPRLKARIAMELAKIPGTPASKRAVQTAIAAIPQGTSISPSLGAHEAIVESVGSFFDPSVLNWLQQRADVVCDLNAEQRESSQTIAVTALKLAHPQDLPVARNLYERCADEIEVDLYDLTKVLLERCGERTSCYLEAVRNPANQYKQTQFTAMKAAYMLGILGDDQVRDQLVAALDDMRNPAVRYTVAQVIDHLCPQGSTEVAGRLQVVLERNKKTGDRNLIASDTPLRQVMYRIRARALP